MNDFKNPMKNTPRETFLISMLNKVIKKYKTLLELFRQTKPCKITEIIEISNIPGESKFAIQITNKNLVLQLKASEIINDNYDLNNFSLFHSEMIRQAAQGKLIEYLKISETEPAYKIVFKKLDRTLQQYIFVIETREKVQFTRTAEEISKDKNLLANMGIQDIYDIGYTHGSESILKEKAALLLAKNKV